MKRKTCKQSKDSNPNWLEKVILPELNRIEYNFTECFLGDGDKILKFKDNISFDGIKIASYSTDVIKQC